MSDELPDFSEAIASLKKQEERHHAVRRTPRVKAMVQGILEIQGQIFEVGLVDLSPEVVRLDSKFPIAARGRCAITLKLRPAVQLICEPIIEQSEFDDGHWCRMKITTNYKFDSLVNLIQKSA